MLPLKFCGKILSGLIIDKDKNKIRVFSVNLVQERTESYAKSGRDF